jgi:cystathionine gamma-synthase
MAGGCGGLLSFQVQGEAAAALAVAGRLRLIARATSLGGTESLIEHRFTIEGAATGVPPNLLRLSVGIEEADDLIADLAQALDGKG